jgi:hypothetical protein
VSIVIPPFGGLAGALFVASGIMLSLYLPAATHLKKLRMGTAGDLVTLIAEALDGLTVIQAYSKQGYFTQARAAPRLCCPRQPMTCLRHAGFLGPCDRSINLLTPSHLLTKLSPVTRPPPLDTPR